MSQPPTEATDKPACNCTLDRDEAARDRHPTLHSEHCVVLKWWNKANALRVNDDYLSRDDVRRLSSKLTSLLMAARPAVVPLKAMEALTTKYSGERGYKAALVGRLPTKDDRLYTILIHEKENRILGVLLWDEQKEEWAMSDDRGALLIMKAHL